MKLLKKLLLWLLALAALAYMGLVVYAYLFSNPSIFNKPAVAHYAKTADLLEFKLADGRITYAKYYPCEGATHTILFSHGNAEDLGTIDSRMRNLQAHGFAVLSYEYPGYGYSEGPCSEEGNYEAINATYDYLTDVMHVPANRIIAYGYSLGGGASIELALHKPIGGLVLESTFTSIFRVATHYRILPWDLFNNVSKIGKIKCPIFFLHGTVDRTVPFWHSPALYAKTAAPKMALWLVGGSHSYMSLLGGDIYWKCLSEFVWLVNATESSPQPAPSTLSHQLEAFSSELQQDNAQKKGSFIFEFHE